MHCKFNCITVYFGKTQYLLHFLVSQKHTYIHFTDHLKLCANIMPLKFSLSIFIIVFVELGGGVDDGLV